MKLKKIAKKKILSAYSKWLISRYGGSSAKEAIFIAIDTLLKECTQDTLPIKLSEIAKGIGINPIPLYKNQIPNAQIINVNNEFRIALQMKTEKPPSIYWSGYPRLRFAYAHELIHCLNFDFSSSPPKRIAPRAIKNEEEVICNYGAGLLVLPALLVKKYIATLDDNNIMSVADHLAKKSQTSLHASFLFLVNADFITENVNKLYILSQNFEGYRGRGIKKPRCIVSALYFEDGIKKQFLPPYKGIEAVSEKWSLINYHNKLFENNSISEIKVQNEIIDIFGKKYLLNGKHTRIEGSSYVWSDLSIFKITN